MSLIEVHGDGRRILLPLFVLRPAPTDLTSVRVDALLDTGVTTSGISSRIASELDLPRRGKRPLISAQGLGQAERFLFRIGVPSSSADGEQFPFVFSPILGFEITEGTSFSAVLGMDILCQCDLELRRTGLCRLRYG